MQMFSWLSYIFWIPFLLWVVLFFWFSRYSNPLFLKKMVKKGKKWAVLPEYVSKDSSFVLVMRLKCIALSAIVSLFNSLSVTWILSFMKIKALFLVLIFWFIFMIIAFFIYKIAVSKVGNVYQLAYFLEYRRVRYESEKMGTFRSEMDIHNRTIWSFTKKLRYAESHKRLWKYVNAMAKTKKIPPDIYAETMYAR